MTSSNGNTFRVTGHLCGEFTGPGEFPTQRPVKRSFDVFFDLRPKKRLSKQPWGWWFETPSSSLWRHVMVLVQIMVAQTGIKLSLAPVMKIIDAYFSLRGLHGLTEDYFVWVKTSLDLIKRCQRARHFLNTPTMLSYIFCLMAQVYQTHTGSMIGWDQIREIG